MINTRWFLPPEQEMIPSFICKQGFLSNEECDRIRDVMVEQGLSWAQIGNSGNNNDVREDLSYRTVSVGRVMEDFFPLLYERLRDQITIINRDFYRFDLTGICEDIQFLRYECAKEGTPAGHYHWHQDYGGGYSSLRKISVIIQLTDPNEYDGCDLEMFTDKMEYPQNKSKGMLTTFPSYVPHRVTDITRGTRDALVTWISGPRFR